MLQISPTNPPKKASESSWSSERGRCLPPGEPALQKDPPGGHFGVNMLAIVDGKPETLSLKKALKCHIQFLFEINTRKYQTLLAKEEKKKEIQEGLIRACGIIDLIIEILRGSKGRDQAWNCLTAGKTDGIRFKTVRSQKAAGKLNFTAAQADAILDMRLYRLIGLEEEALLKDHEETLKNIAKYQDILKNPKSMSAAITKELDALEKEFGRPRKTEVIQAGEVILEEMSRKRSRSPS